ncbi:MarR family transcriptional regulator [Xylanimonas oleitrophica]|uniref:MarR family transcriptional regulator n=1 Tax=Xylanimonas oleitrophica TaxID=2607479 RepID=A0A2W5Y4Z7_9MICO|nr:transcriptional regulator [Xylanimonas oleitrophica]PZR53074.1 MarR family transcriptional regulator [Xylanimonas oleitrophica]
MSAEPRALPPLDPVIHPIQRLRICALLEPVTEEEFGTLRELLGTSDSALSKQLAALGQADYVQQRRASRGGRSRVWVSLTPRGRRAFQGHLAALTALAGGSEG